MGADPLWRREVSCCTSFGDFDAYWAFHLERDRERNHASRYEGGKICDPLPAPKPRRLAFGSKLSVLAPVDRLPACGIRGALFSRRSCW